MSIAIRQIADRYHTAYELADIELDYLQSLYAKTPVWRFMRRAELWAQIINQRHAVYVALRRFQRAGFNET